MSDAVQSGAALRAVRHAIRRSEAGEAWEDLVQDLNFAIGAETLPLPHSDSHRMRMENALVLLATVGESQEVRLAALRTIEAALSS
jgi:hypothetical protein